MSNRVGILSGLRIVEGSAFVAAPLGGMTLAQLGAEVIRFDPIGGGLDYSRWPITEQGVSLFWAGMNKGKKSIAVDFRQPEGVEILSQLITAPGENNGLFLTNFPAKGWLDFDVLQKKRDDLIMVNVLGDRHGGSQVDYTVNPAVGFPDVTGSGDEPINHVLPAWDNITGQMAAVGLLAAERHRRLTGEGQLVKLPLADVALATVGNLGNIAEVQINDTDRPRYGNYLYGAFGKDFVTADGKRVMVIGLTARQWKGLINATGLGDAMDELAKVMKLNFKLEGDRFAAREQIAAVFQPWIASRPLQDVQQAFDANGVCWNSYQNFRQMVESDPECSEDNPMFKTTHQPGVGDYLMPASPLQFGSADRLAPMPAPVLGQDTEWVLADVLGLSTAEVGRLHDQGVVASA